ncbi:TetR/AcrR family transcriptional regulator [Herbaspirillum sp. GCM10030257]|uniref:TetR/AcrR family transcriptional regulator n=1 Tax=Herbaspirillum sp. GCM10030257 TaxID=3273393 RepID=UPI00360A064F
MTQITKTPDPAVAHRHRLLEGMAQAVAAKGYAETTIADIVREASVSRRTFYEYFNTKADCLIALYTAASHNAIDVLRNAIDPARPWQSQVETAIHAYLGCLAQNPVLMRTLFIEILGLGAEGLAARRRVNNEIASFMLKVINAEQDGKPRETALTPDMAMTVVGGINELVLQAIEQDSAADVAKLAEPAIRLVKAVTRDVA